MRVLLTGWASFLHGEATAGDVLSLRAVAGALTGAGIDHDIAWSPGFRPGAFNLDDATPDAYTHVVFACGPVHGPQLCALHERFARCRRVAVGVSVPDPADPAVTGFHRVLPRDDGESRTPDLSLSAPVQPGTVLGVVLAPRQPEYGSAGRHDDVHSGLTRWLAGLDCARLPLDTRLARDDWTRCATPDQFLALVSRADCLVSTRLHGLVLGLKAGVPVLAVDPVAGGGKVSAQAAVLDWPAVAGFSEVVPDKLDAWLRWCLSADGRDRAAAPRSSPDVLAELMRELEPAR